MQKRAVDTAGYTKQVPEHNYTDLDSRVHCSFFEVTHCDDPILDGSPGRNLVKGDTLEGVPDIRFWLPMENHDELFILVQEASESLKGQFGTGLPDELMN